MFENWEEMNKEIADIEFRNEVREKVYGTIIDMMTEKAKTEEEKTVCQIMKTCAAIGNAAKGIAHNCIENTENGEHNKKVLDCVNVILEDITGIQTETEKKQE